VYPAFGNYHDHVEMSNLLLDYATRFPDITKLSVAGFSTQGREMWVLQISDRPGVTESLEPKFKYVGNIHGDETVGRELCLYMIDFLLTNYGTDSRVTNLVDSTNIFILPSVNPDGFELARRGNANNIDLNRDFPDEFRDGVDSTDGREVETQVLMNWDAQHQFVMSGQLHGGAVVVNYPRSAPDATNTTLQYCESVDDGLFVHLSKDYSFKHPTMYQSTRFPNDGITNGCEWYVIWGGMQDWNYVFRGCMELTIEVSQVKYPAASTLAGHWDDHREPMLAFTENVHLGIKGSILEKSTGMPITSGVSVDVFSADTGKPITRTRFVQNEHGNYFIPLLPGTYELVVASDGGARNSQMINVEESHSQMQAGSANIHNVAL
jgi:carboxypeptidase D